MLAEEAGPTMPDVAEIEGDGALPEIWWPQSEATGPLQANYDVTPEGDEFITGAFQRVGTSSLRMVQNWTAHLDDSECSALAERCRARAADGRIAVGHAGCS